LLDIRIELVANDAWRATLFGLNVLDEEVLAEVIPSAEFGGSFVAPGARRLIGIEVGYSF
jgi:iron complex outermembrane receptor protein